MTIKHAQIFAVIRRIPKGYVATYGQIAQMIGYPRCARQIGYALSALSNSESVPWQRVVNAKGEISIRSNSDYAALQHELLKEEGVMFDEKGRIPLSRYQWRPEGYSDGVMNINNKG